VHNPKSEPADSQTAVIASNDIGFLSCACWVATTHLFVRQALLLRVQQKWLQVWQAMPTAGIVDMRYWFAMVCQGYSVTVEF